MISFRLDDRDAAHVGFAVSPLLEAVLSLHVLAEPGHHPLQHDFVRRMRGLPAPLKRAIAHFRFVYRWMLPDAFFPGSSGGASFERELAGLLSLGEETVLCDFGRPLYDHAGHREAAVYGRPEVRKTMLRRAAAGGRNGRPAASDLLDDPAAFLRAFAAMLEEYWHAAFAEEWERLEAPLAGAAQEARGELEARGAGALAELLRPHVRFDEGSRRLGSVCRTSTSSRSAPRARSCSRRARSSGRTCGSTAMILGRSDSSSRRPSSVAKPARPSRPRTCSACCVPWRTTPGCGR